MILRRWRGAVRSEDAEAYLAHQGDTGVRDYRDTPGNLGVLVLRRPAADGLVEVITLSLWGSMDDVRSFAGDRPEVAVFYPGDDDLLVEKDNHVDHYEVTDADLDPALLATTSG
jgi:heme-degrading monooxygenase HmoA